MLRAWALFVFTAFLGLAVPAFAGPSAGAAAAFALSPEIAADEPDVPPFVSSGESSMTSWSVPVSRVNWFAYAGGDPVNRWDPSGLDWITVQNNDVYYHADYTDPNSPWWKAWGNGRRKSVKIGTKLPGGKPHGIVIGRINWQFDVQLDQQFGGGVVGSQELAQAAANGEQYLSDGHIAGSVNDAAMLAPIMQQVTGRAFHSESPVVDFLGGAATTTARLIPDVVDVLLDTPENIYHGGGALINGGLPSQPVPKLGHLAGSGVEKLTVFAGGAGYNPQSGFNHLGGQTATAALVVGGATQLSTRVRDISRSQAAIESFSADMRALGVRTKDIRSYVRAFDRPTFNYSKNLNPFKKYYRHFNEGSRMGGPWIHDSKALLSASPYVRKIRLALPQGSDATGTAWTRVPLLRKMASGRIAHQNSDFTGLPSDVQTGGPMQWYIPSSPDKRLPYLDFFEVSP